MASARPRPAPGPRRAARQATAATGPARLHREAWLVAPSTGRPGGRLKGSDSAPLRQLAGIALALSRTKVVDCRRTQMTQEVAFVEMAAGNLAWVPLPGWS